MTDEHRTFSIYSTAVPIVEQLLGHVSRWYPAGSIDYRRDPPTKGGRNIATEVSLGLPLYFLVAQTPAKFQVHHPKIDPDDVPG